MNRRPIVHPLIDISGVSKDALDAIGFRITNVYLAKITDGWLRLSVDWAAKTDEWKVKYPTDSGSGSSSGGGSESEYVHLEFPEVAAPFIPLATEGPLLDGLRDNKATLDIGIYIKTGRRLNPPRLGYRYRFHDNTKYGVCVYFAPIGWDSGRDKTLYSWRERRKAEPAIEPRT